MEIFSKIETMQPWIVKMKQMQLYLWIPSLDYSAVSTSEIQDSELRWRKQN